MRKSKPFRSAKQLNALIDSYFQSLEAKQAKAERSKTLQAEPPTFAGLMLFTGFNSREEFDQFKAIPRYKADLSRAMLLMQHIYEKRLLTGSSTGIATVMKYLFDTDDEQVKMAEGDESVNTFKVDVVHSGVRPVASEKEVVL